MEKVIKEITAGSREIEITLSKAELEPLFDKAYREAQPHIDMKGFRKGKVPMNVVKKYYGKSIEEEAIKDISTEKFNEIIKEEKIEIIGHPYLKDMKESEEGTTFIIYFEVIPSFELNDYKELKLHEPVHVVSDDEVEAQIKNICINSGSLELVDSIEDELTLVEINMTVVDPDQLVPILGVKSQKSKIFLADKKYVHPELKNALMNRPKGDSFFHRPNLYDPSAPDETFRFEILNIQRLTPLEFNNGMVESYTKGRLNTTEEFREEVGYGLQEQWDQKARQMIEDQIINKLVEMNNNIDVPETVAIDVIGNMVKDIKEKYKTMPNVEKLTIDTMYNDLYPFAAKTIKWEFIRNKIAEKEDLKIEDHDIEHILDYEAERLKIDREKVRQKLLENPAFTQNLLNKKVFDLVIDFAEMEDISFEEFNNLYGHQHDHDHEDDFDDDHEYHNHDNEHDHEHHDHDHHEHGDEHDHEHHVSDNEHEK